ncbi:hypothetical protein JTB14_026766 [Gonioctena quinquepunctata]|nr:hypothetical protein JTB14_026766 [Gonioctena quinquepunctata]
MWKLIFYLSIISQGIGEKDVNDDETLIAFLANLEVLNPENIFMLSVTDIDFLCKQIKLGPNSFQILHIPVYLRDFDLMGASSVWRDVVFFLFKGRFSFVLGQSLFLSHYRSFVSQGYSDYQPCLSEMKSEFETCNGPADWIEETDGEIICRTYKSIVDCYYIKAAKVCGIEAAKAITELIESVIGAVMIKKCKGMNSMPYVKDTMPENYIKRSSSKETLYTSIDTTIVAVTLLTQHILS